MVSFDARIVADMRYR